MDDADPSRQDRKLLVNFLRQHQKRKDAELQAMRDEIRRIREALAIMENPPKETPEEVQHGATYD